MHSLYSVMCVHCIVCTLYTVCTLKSLYTVQFVHCTIGPLYSLYTVQYCLYTASEQWLDGAVWLCLSWGSCWRSGQQPAGWGPSGGRRRRWWGSRIKDDQDQGNEVPRFWQFTLSPDSLWPPHPAAGRRDRARSGLTDNGQSSPRRCRRRQPTTYWNRKWNNNKTGRRKFITSS